MKLLKAIPNSEDFVLHLDNSAVEHLQTCPRSFEWNSVYKRVADMPSPSLTYGGNIHAILENCVHSDRKELESFIDWVFTTNPTNCEWRTAEFARTCMTLYKKRWAASTIVFDTNKLEQSFSFPLEPVEVNSFVLFPKKLLVEDESESNDPFYVGTIYPHWTGVIDAQVETQRGPFILDHKTSSIHGATYYQEHRISSQMFGYVKAAKLEGFDAKGFIINLIVGRKPTRTGIAHEFERHFYDVSDEMLSEWELDQRNLVSTIVHYLKNGSFPKATKWCVGKYGTCQYLEGCALGYAGAKTYMKSSLFKHNDWNPLVKA